MVWLQLSFKNSKERNGSGNLQSGPLRQSLPLGSWLGCTLVTKTLLHTLTICDLKYFISGTLNLVNSGFVASIQEVISGLAIVNLSWGSLKHRREAFWERTKAYLLHRGGFPKKKSLLTYTWTWIVITKIKRKRGCVWALWRIAISCLLFSKCAFLVALKIYLKHLLRNYFCLPLSFW